mmetsp:Transcript_27394/g.49323  ORF Transcript_27394/g.49323 Transcript_27394/m.49323 type:complete len:260 (+) Transcript_27394:2033-2812(+)
MGSCKYTGPAADHPRIPRTNVTHARMGCEYRTAIKTRSCFSPVEAISSRMESNVGSAFASRPMEDPNSAAGVWSRKLLANDRDGSNTTVQDVGVAGPLRPLWDPSETLRWSDDPPAQRPEASRNGLMCSSVLRAPHPHPTPVPRLLEDGRKVRLKDTLKLRLEALLMSSSLSRAWPIINGFVTPVGELPPPRCLGELRPELPGVRPSQARISDSMSAGDLAKLRASEASDTPNLRETLSMFRCKILFMGPSMEPVASVP